MIIKHLLFGLINPPSKCVLADQTTRLRLRAFTKFTRCSIITQREAHDDCNSEKLLNAFRSCLYKSLEQQDSQPGNKVSVIGAGAVGMACAISLLTKGVTNNLAIFDVNRELCSAECLDLLHGSLFLNNCRIQQCCEVEGTKDSRIVVVTCGARVEANKSRLQVAQKTADIIKAIMPDLVKQSPRAVFIVVSNPADVMTWVAHQISNLPYERCISTGCHLDSARFRLFVAQAVGVSTSSVQGYVVGEHGDHSVPMWSALTVGGVKLQTLVPFIGTNRDPMKWSKVHKEVVNAAFKVIAGKGYTSWAIGLTITDVVSAIFENSYRVLSLSTNAKGMCGIKEEVFLSLPCIVNEWGLCGIVRPHLSRWESDAMKKSAQILLKAQSEIKL